MRKPLIAFAIVLVLTTTAHGLALQERASPESVLSRGSADDTPSRVSAIKTLVDAITEAELLRYVRDLEAMGTRYAPSEGNRRAATYIEGKFSSFGLRDVTVDEFSYYDTETGLFEVSRNVVASKKGTREPEKIIILAAHFDSVTRRAPDRKTSFRDKDHPSPGADDNATGAAAVLAAARAFGERDFDRTIRFIAFSAEEGGIHGSAHYASECARKEEKILAVINVDMLGFADQHPEDIDLFANRESEWLLDEFVANAPLYAPGLLIYRIVDDRYDGSDHGPFWYNGYPAVGLMEDYYPSNPHYHSPADTTETVDFAFALQSTRLAAATLAELAGLRVEGEPSPTLPRGESASASEVSGKRLLVTLSPSPHHADIIDISLPSVHSRRRIQFEELTPETWATPRHYPVAMTSAPSGRSVYVSMMRWRAPGKDCDQGMLVVLDPTKAEIVTRIRVGKHPGEGAFDSEGTRFYLPYRGEARIDVLDATSLERVDSMAIPQPAAKLVLDEKAERAVAISPETDSVWILDLKQRSPNTQIDGIRVPKDILLLKGGRQALVCGYEDGMIHQIDISRAAIVARVASGTRPFRLVASPEKDLILSIHRSSSRIGVFRVPSDPGREGLIREDTIDLGEEVADADFAGSYRVYFVSSGKQRLLGLDLTTRETFWGMRTGDVRPAGGVERLLFLGPR